MKPDPITSGYVQVKAAQADLMALTPLGWAKAASLLVVSLAILILAGGVVLEAFSPHAPSPNPSAAASSESASSPSPPATYPPEILQMAVAISTFVAPTLTPTATAMPVATAAPTSSVEICGSWTKNGTVCTQPLPPAPTPTPIPRCPTNPGQFCIWAGTPVVDRGSR